MQKAKIAYWTIAVIVVTGLGLFFARNVHRPAADTGMTEDQQVKEVVQEFGQRMKNVSLLAPDAADQIRKEYGGLVSEDILAFWAKDPSQAPGRRTSSPWPDRIQIIEINKQDDGAYEVQGAIIEVTSMEAASGEAASQSLVALKLRQPEDKWIITGYQSLASQ